MSKGIILGVGGAIALLAVALSASADSKPKAKKPVGPGPSDEEYEEDSGQDACDGQLAAINALKGVRASLKAQLVDIDAELMNVYQNEETALPGYVAQLEGARNALKAEIAAKDSQIEVMRQSYEEQCG